MNSTADLRALPEEALPGLCAEIREFLINSISKTGGHLASNLGTVELAVALERVYDPEKDRIVFDVGHQCYTHKLLTGRREMFDTLRQYGGISGFPKPCESECDAFIAGHASSAVSVTLGMARARTGLGADYDVVAVVGDGALTGGLAYEGLCSAGQSGEPMVVILNDNAMSIDRNVGGMAKLLSRLRVKPQYFEFKRRYRKTVGKAPKLYRFLHGVKEDVKDMVLPDNIFDDMGFYYLGPVDGHDIGYLESAVRWARDMRIPVLLHVITQKGKGYTWAERFPEKYHGVGPFDPDTGIIFNGVRNFSDVFGKALCDLAEEDGRVTAVTAAMSDGTGLSDFSHKFPGRFYDTGIAEGHAVAMCAGMAKQGLVPVAAIYSTFLQRGYDMLLHDVSLLNLHVVLAVDRAGLVGGDGETHHGVFDVDYLCSVPGMTVYCPASFAELRTMLRHAVAEEKGPVAVRYPRGGEGGYKLCDMNAASVLREGADVTLAAYGIMINNVLEAAERLEKEGISAEVVKLSRICPLDTEPVLASLLKTRRIIVAEDVCAHGCVGERLLAAAAGKSEFASRLINLGEGIAVQGSVPELWKHYGLDVESIARAAGELMARESGK
ncbi:MAG: 1-deoxy-D-xylulose-5-phosphate synthase [Clostridia bacterium]|nr:1-deoxy-D-xylulose-5-phosphate synthase [Clostridia bacterium]